MLQEAGMWRYAATLTAQALSVPERAASLERWAAHKQQARLQDRHRACNDLKIPAGLRMGRGHHKAGLGLLVS